MKFKNILIIFVMFFASSINSSIFPPEFTFGSSEHNLIDDFSLNGQSDKVFSVFVNLTKQSTFLIYGVFVNNYRNIASCSFVKLYEVAPGETISLNKKFGKISRDSSIVGFFITSASVCGDYLNKVRGDLVFLNSKNEVQMNNNVSIQGITRAGKFIMHKFLYFESINSCKDMDVFKQRYSPVEYNKLILMAINAQDSNAVFYDKHFEEFKIAQ